MANNSNFTSNFNNTTGIFDILSSVSGSISLSKNIADGPYNGRYFYLGNLLIQFSDINAGFPSTSAAGSGYNINFPRSFGGTPYSVALYPISHLSGANSNIALTDCNSTTFTFSISGARAAVGFIAIGPR